MANSDIQGALSLFKTVGSNATSLKAQLAALGTGSISDAQSQALQALAALAARGESQLARGASKVRDDTIQSITDQIQGLQDAIIIGAPVEATNEKIADLTAKRAGLLLEAVGDFSDIVSPEKVHALIALAVQVHDDAAAKKKAAQIISLVEEIVTKAVEIAAAVAVFA
ncbi:MAG TPA: hypothetical protein VER96_04205 [Polyangiaceae bacterium]|nr:hypothetical protein [Polyangiaceae bacterium]